MDLREQLISELRMQDEIDQANIEDLKERMKTEAFLLSTVTGGLGANAAREACRNRMNEASKKKDDITQRNDWMHDMLSKYQ